MSLNIKSARVHDMAREAARRTGQSQTAVVEQALEQLLRTLDDDGEGRQRALYWFDQIAARRTPEQRAALREASDDLYDSDGLPR